MGKSQTEDVLNYMRDNKDGITSMIAFEKFGATRLSAIIYELRRQGYNITTTMMECRTRYGKTTEYAKYILEEQ